jgi:hypothetical protein
VLSDDSAAEQLAVKGAFRGVYELGGEKTPDHFLCTVHSDRTLRRNIGDAHILTDLRAALWHRKTEAGAIESIGRAMKKAYQIMLERNPDYLLPWQRATTDGERIAWSNKTKGMPSLFSTGYTQSQDTSTLRSTEPLQKHGIRKRYRPSSSDGEDAPYPTMPTSTMAQSTAPEASTAASISTQNTAKKKQKRGKRARKGKQDLVKYIFNEWFLTRKMWAAYARQHSPLLMQITTTNAVEAWHNSLKRGSSTTAQVRTQMSLKGCVQTVMAI